MIFCSIAISQTTPKTLPAKKTTATIKVDGKLDEQCWKDSIFATQFIEWRPNFGAVEGHTSRTEVWLLYDNTSVYVAGYCHEK